MALKKELEDSVKSLVKLNDDELELELGRRLRINENEFEKADSLSAARAMPLALDEAELAGPIDFLQNLAHSFLRRFNRQLYSLVCNPEDPDHDAVKDALGQGTERVALVVAGILVAKFAWLPAIIAVVASMVAKKAVKAGHGAVCDAWKKEIED